MSEELEGPMPAGCSAMIVAVVLLSFALSGACVVGAWRWALGFGGG